jgi:hypothetical protein
VFVMNSFCEHEIVLTTLMLFSESHTQNAMFVMRALCLQFLYFTLRVCGDRIFLRLVNSKDEELVFYNLLNFKDTWGGPRDPTSGLCSGSRGSCPYNSWLNSLIISNLTL